MESCEGRRRVNSDGNCRPFKRDDKVLGRGSGRCIMTQILDEMREWLYQETFDFPSLPQQFQGNINDVKSISYLLLLLSDFLKNTRMSEDRCVLELLSEYVEREDSTVKLMWWMLTTKNQEMLSKTEILGPALSFVYNKYISSRESLEIKVNLMLGMLGTWADAYSNGQALGELVQLHRLLGMVRQNFKEWVEEVLITKAGRVNCVQERSVLPMETILEKVSQVHRNISRLPDVPRAAVPCWVGDSVDVGSQPMKRERCTVSCLLNTEFLLFSRDTPLCVKPRTVLYSHTPDGLELVPKYLDEGTATSYCQLAPPNAGDSHCMEAQAFGEPIIAPEATSANYAEPAFEPSSMYESPRVSLTEDPFLLVPYHSEYPAAVAQSRGGIFAGTNMISETALEWPQESPDANERTYADVFSHFPAFQEVSNTNHWFDDSLIASTSLIYRDLLSASACYDIQQGQIECFLSNLIRLARLSEKEK